MPLNTLPIGAMPLPCRQPVAGVPQIQQQPTLANLQAQLTLPHPSLAPLCSIYHHLVLSHQDQIHSQWSLPSTCLNTRPCQPFATKTSSPPQLLPTWMRHIRWWPPNNSPLLRTPKPKPRTSLRCARARYERAELAVALLKPPHTSMTLPVMHLLPLLPIWTLQSGLLWTFSHTWRLRRLCVKQPSLACMPYPKLG